MESGHCKQRALPFFLVFLASWFAASQAAAAPRVVCVDPQDSQLVARIQGQTRDLGIELAWLADDSRSVPTAPGLAELAQRSAAEYVVVVQPSAAGGLTVYVYDAARKLLRERAVPPARDGEHLAASTMAETAALIVRGELSAALALAKEEAETKASAPAPPPPPAPEPAPPTPPPHVAPPPAAPRHEPVLSLAAAIRVSAPGAGLWLGGAGLGVRLGWSVLELGVLVGTTLPADLQQEALRVSLRRHDLELEAFARLRLAPQLALLLGAGAGVVVYARKTQSTGSAQMKTPDNASWSALLGPRAELRWQFAHSVSAAARVGVDFIPQPTHLTYQNPDQTRASLGELVAYEPWAALGLVVDIWE
jgi:hypothetical protein